jgi:hypothetical protein
MVSFYDYALFPALLYDKHFELWVQETEETLFGSGIKQLRRVVSVSSCDKPHKRCGRFLASLPVLFPLFLATKSKVLPVWDSLGRPCSS